MNVRYLDAALADVQRAGRKLDRARRGVGGRFVTAFHRAAGRIAAMPRGYPHTEDGPDEPENREVYLARFRYRVVYAIWQDEAVIVAVVHASQEPAAWVDRLDELTPPGSPPSAE